MIIGIAIAFILPMAIAAMLVGNTTDWMSWSRKNNGTLVHPAQSLGPFQLFVTSEKEPFGLESIQDKWNVIYIGAGQCNSACQEILYKTRQSRLAKGKEMHRIRRLYIVNEVAADTTQLQQLIQQAHPDLLLLQAANQHELSRFVSQFEIDNQRKPGRIYLVDPLGNLMMYYESDFPAKGLIKDLGRLLHVSQIG